MPNSLIWSWLAERIEAALDFVFPAECYVCHDFLSDSRVGMFCAACWNKILIIEPPVCARCGMPVTTALDVTPDFCCQDCRAKPPYFDRTIAIGYYADILREAIKQFKFHRQTQLKRPLAQLMLTNLPATLALSDYHAFIPVPLHLRRQRERGYNQAAMLARELSRQLGLPVLTKNLRRVRPTERQTDQVGRKARQKNVQNAFKISFPENIQDKNLILVDDIMTTGATVNECAKMLKQAGARSVLALVLSRRVLDFKPPKTNTPTIA